MMLIRTTTLAALVMFSSTLFAGSIDPSAVSKKKQTPQGLYLAPTEAYDATKSHPDRVLFVDVRTPAEIEFVGSITNIDANIPYMLNNFSEWDDGNKRYKKEPNSSFSLAIENETKKKGMNKKDKIILICRSGKRSSKAATLLSQLGYSNVWTITEGFEGDKVKAGLKKGQRAVNGWKNAGLPWSYKPVAEKVYLKGM